MGADAANFFLLLMFADARDYRVERGRTGETDATRSLIAARDALGFGFRLLDRCEDRVSIVEESLGGIRMLDAASEAMKQDSFDLLFELGSDPFDIVVEWDDRAGQALPVEASQHRRGEAGKVDFDDMVGAKELVEAAPEMPARFDDDRARPGDVEPHHLEEDGVGALHPPRHDDDGDAADGERADFLVQTELYDAMVLDLGLPKMDGLTLLRNWRDAGLATPVLVLTARGSWYDKVRGIDGGADDYVSKPFRVEEVLARLRALIRRASGHLTPELRAGSVGLDPRQSRVTLDGAPVTPAS